MSTNPSPATPEPESGKTTMVERDHRASRALAQRPEGAIDTSPPAVIARMLQSGIDPATMERMLALQERWEANEAKKAYVAAMALAKVEAPTIRKDKHVKFQTAKGTTEYDHATIGNVTGLIVPWLARYGFSHRWDTKQEPNKITVTCVIAHERGHSESVTLFAAHDDSGGKNSIQALISAKSYLERHTLTAASGLATADQEDDDGRTGIVDNPGQQQRTAPAAPTRTAEKQPYDEDDFRANLPAWRDLVKSGKTTPDKILAKVQTKFLLLDKQRKAIRDLATEAADAHA